MIWPDSGLHQEGKSPSEIAKLMGRDLSGICRRLQRTKPSVAKSIAPVGRPPALSPAMVDKLVRTAEHMIRHANAKYQVTIKMVMASLKLKCCQKTARRALHARGVRFHVMREKPVRTEADEADRLKFARTHSGKPLSYWTDQVDAYMDNKSFPAYLTGPARAYAAKRTARGTYRAKGQGLAKGHVKPKKSLA